MAKRSVINRGDIYGDIPDNESIFTITYRTILQRLRNAAMARIGWRNLPDGIPARYLEQLLNDQGHCCFSNALLNTYCVAACAYSRPNIYNEPTIADINTVNGLHARVKLTDAAGRTDAETRGVMIYNNYSRLPTLPFLRQYAYKIAKAQATIDVNINAQKTPIMVKVADQKSLLSLKNAYAKYEGYAPVIFSDEQLALPEAMTVYKTDAPYVVDKLQEYIRIEWSNALEFLGIRSVGFEKKERLVSAEVSESTNAADIAFVDALNMRKAAAEKINAVFGLDIEPYSAIEEENELDYNEIAAIVRNFDAGTAAGDAAGADRGGQD